MDFTVSLIVPTMIEVDYIKLLWYSYNKNTVFPGRHDFWVHINGTLPIVEAFCKEQGINYTMSKKNEGITHAFNASMDKLKTNYVLLLNDDMYLLPGWDIALEESLTGDKWDMRAPMPLYYDRGEPPYHLAGDKKYGGNTVQFQEELLLKEYRNYVPDDVIVSHRPPVMVTTEAWKELEGWCPKFVPGVGGDPDFAYRFWLANGNDHTKMQSVPECIIYHFGQTTHKRTNPRFGAAHTIFERKHGINVKQMRKKIHAGQVLFKRIIYEHP